MLFADVTFSLTSSSVDKLIVAAAPHMTKDHPMRDSFEKILSYVGKLGLLPDRNAEDDEQQNCESEVGQDAVLGVEARSHRLLWSWKEGRATDDGEIGLHAPGSCDV